MDCARWQVGTAAKRLLLLWGRTGKGENAATPAKHPQRHRRATGGTARSYPAGDKRHRATWSEDYIFAGSSAFLLLVANLFPDYWFVSFFALMPFVYRILEATLSESLRLGFLFGLLFFGGLVVDSLMISPLLSVFRLLCGTVLFTLFAWTLGWSRERWGFNPFILVLLWVGLGMGLVRFGFVGELLGEAGFSHPFFGGLVVLFNSLAISAIIVLFNSLLVLAVVNTLQVTRPKGRTVQEEGRILELFSISELFPQRVHLVPESRAPPL
jgi:hypothetical protein